MGVVEQSTTSSHPNLDDTNAQDTQKQIVVKTEQHKNNKTSEIKQLWLMLHARLQACLCTLHCLNRETSEVSNCEQAPNVMNQTTATMVSTCACIHTQHGTDTRHASAALDAVCHHVCNIFFGLVWEKVPLT
jgi:hypothetical protein